MPYSVAASDSAGFLMHIEVYFKNKEKPKIVCFKYDLMLNQEGEASVNHWRCEKLNFINPNKDFKRKLIKAGGIIVGPESTVSRSKTSSESPPAKKMKKCDHASEETSKE